LRYKLVYSHRAIKDIHKLDSEIKKRAEPKLGSYRFRVGDYRVIFDIEGDDIVTLRVGH